MPKKDEPVLMTAAEWAKQEKELIDQFVLKVSSSYGADYKAHPGEIDDMFRLWHEDDDALRPEET